ncbi:MAG TPA: CbiQ family ECF transporter T component [Candidatus Sulfotelmatobacter sp.]|nr:CbiQ family ECF transporter T component [Candidatus Sulfotelmatobacter sp.]
MNALSSMDLIATAGRTPWHRASALSKIALALLILLLAVFTPSLSLLGVLFGVAVLLALSARVPVRLLLTAMAYPVAFALLFVLARWDGTWITPARILLRPLTCCVAVIWLMGSTPYPDVFAPLSRVLPRAVGDGLFLTYRALFDLIDRSGRLWRAIRLRGGAEGSARRRLSLAGEGLGTLVLYGFERSQRFYATMQLRGHSGRICGCRHYADVTPADLLTLAAAVGVILAAVTLWGRP